MESNRNDIYYCENCGYFFDVATEDLFEISYTEMPADFALQVMNDRQAKTRTCHMKARRKLYIKPRNYK